MFVAQSRQVSEQRWGLGYALFPQTRRHRRDSYTFSSSSSSSSDSDNEDVSRGESPRQFLFGHTGVGGSIAYTCPVTGVSVAVTVNRLISRLEPTVKILDLVARQTGTVNPLRSRVAPA